VKEILFYVSLVAVTTVTILFII